MWSMHAVSHLVIILSLAGCGSSADGPPEYGTNALQAEAPAQDPPGDQPAADAPGDQPAAGAPGGPPAAQQTEVPPPPPEMETLVLFGETWTVQDVREHERRRIQESGWDVVCGNGDQTLRARVGADPDEDEARALQIVEDVCAEPH